MFEIPWIQMSGAVAGGLVGSFTGFLSNIVHERRVRRGVRRNIACALIGEIDALATYIENNYLALLRASIEPLNEQADTRTYIFRGERDYMPIFRNIGATVGFLPTPLPRDIVTWYTRLAAALERAHALHELAIQGDPRSLDYAVSLAKRQQEEMSSLIEDARPLLTRLEAL
jgi:hypothetical protein